jgi:hypothetical protein
MMLTKVTAVDVEAQAEANANVAPELTAVVTNRLLQAVGSPTMAQNSGWMLPHSALPSDFAHDVDTHEAPALDAVLVDAPDALNGRSASESAGVSATFFLRTC